MAQDSPNRPFRKVAGVVGNCRVARSLGIEPDLMATCSLPVDLEPQSLQLFRYLTIAKSGKTAHLSECSGSNHDGVVSTFGSGTKPGQGPALFSRLDQFTRNVTGNFECFGNRSALSYQAGELVGSCEKNPLWQFFDLDSDGQLHMR